MFNPEDFLTWAKKATAQATDQATARICIGRAYYTAHLVAREKIRRHYAGELVSLARKGDEHRFVREKLVERHRADISNKLIGLATKRNRADYDLAN